MSLLPGDDFDQAGFQWDAQPGPMGGGLKDVGR